VTSGRAEDTGDAAPGEVIDLICEGCNDPAGWQGGEPPLLPDPRPQVLDPIVAYQVVHMLEGVIQRGTATSVRRKDGLENFPLAGKTGTSNDYKDALFYGFSPDLIVGIRVGYDSPRPLGEGEGGSAVAAPIFAHFMQKAMAGREALPFRVPPGVRMVNIDARTGELPGPATDTVILEAFRPGTEPGVAFDDEGGLMLSGSGGDIFRSVASEDAALPGLPGMPGLPGAPAPPATADPLGEALPGAAGAAPSDGEAPAEAPASEGLGDTW